MHRLQVIPGTPCAHYVSHRLELTTKKASCDEGYLIRVADVIAALTKIKPEDVQGQRSNGSAVLSTASFRAFASSLLLLAAGCGSSEIVCHPVTGTVTVANEPAAGAVVILHPRSTDPRVQKLRPYATVNSAGKFTLNCMQPGDGAPEGVYDVTIVWELLPPQSERSADPEASTSVPDKLQGKYADPKSSGLEAVIKQSQNELTYKL